MTPPLIQASPRARRLIALALCLTLAAIVAPRAWAPTGALAAPRVAKTAPLPVAAPAVLDTFAALPDSVARPHGFSVPDDSLIPGGGLGASIRRGREIMTATRDSLPGHVGNRLACTNCHRDAGTRASAGTWVGSFASFPQYNARAGRVITIEDRVNECLRRSLAGTPIDGTSRDMADIVAYMAFLSNGMPHGKRAAWLGYRRITPAKPDPAAGAELYKRECVRCHLATGEGAGPYPPVWGDGSFAIGAGMSRLNTAAAFIRWNMPWDKPGTLTDQQAYDVAAYVLTHPRPDTPGKEHDWPNGDPPPDAAYETLGKKAGR